MGQSGNDQTHGNYFSRLSYAYKTKIDIILKIETMHYCYLFIITNFTSMKLNVLHNFSAPRQAHRLHIVKARLSMAALILLRAHNRTITNYFLNTFFIF